MKEYLVNPIPFQMFDELPIWSAPFGLKLLEHIDYKKNISALDIGFGTGFPLTEIAMRLGGSSIVYGIDLSLDAIEKTHKKVEYYGINNVKLIEGFAESIPLANNSIDLITSNNGLNNVSDIDKAFGECARIITKGGQLILTMNLDGSMFEFYDILKDTLSDFQLYDEIRLMEKHIVQKRPAVNGIVSKLREQGFEIKDLKYDQFNYYFADGTAMFNHYFIRLAFMNAWIEILPKEKLEVIFDKIENELNKKAELLGKVILSIPYVVINAIKNVR
jgi:Methylase involved in ubiquinone/menaquinone biosynthesis